MYQIGINVSNYTCAHVYHFRIKTNPTSKKNETKGPKNITRVNKLKKKPIPDKTTKPVRKQRLTCTLNRRKEVKKHIGKGIKVHYDTILIFS